MNMNHNFGLPEQAIQKLESVFNAYPQIQRVIIYGSRAMGNYRKGSDIDLCIEAENLTFSELMRMEEQIDDLLLPWSIDLSIKSHIDNPELLEHIREYGKTFYP